MNVTLITLLLSSVNDYSGNIINFYHTLCIISQYNIHINPFHDHEHVKIMTTSADSVSGSLS